MQALMRLSTQARDMAICEIPEPVLQRPDWVLIQVAYAGVCGSDIKMMDEDALGPYAKLKPPVVLGHEASGVVVRTGETVKGVHVGDRVVYETTVDNCGLCRYCKSGDWNMCAVRKGLGSSINGSFAPLVAVPARNVHVLADAVDLQTAALAEPLACAVHIVEEMGHVKRGEQVVIIGPGTIGMCCGIVARASGARVIMLGTPHSRHRLDIAEQMGFDVLINDAVDLERQVCRLCDGELADVAIDAAGTQASFNQAVHLVRKMGRVVIGAARTHDPRPMELDIKRLYRYQLQMACAASTKPSSWTEAVQILSQHTNELARLVTHRFPLSDWEQAFAVTRSKEAFKAMIVFPQTNAGE